MTENPLIDTLHAQYDIGKIFHCAMHEGGLVNNTYRIKAEKGEFALTAFLHRSMQEVCARAEIVLRLTGLPVASPVGTRTGNFVAEIDALPAWMCPWLRGSSFVTEQHHHKLPMTERAHRTVIHHFQKLHEQTNRISEEMDDMSDFVPKLPTKIDECPVDPMVESLIGHCQDCYRDIDVPVLPPDTIVHGDFERQNILFSDGALTGIIDFDALRQGSLSREWSHCAFNHSCCDPEPSPEYLNLYSEASSFRETSASLRRALLAHMARFCEEDVRGFQWIARFREADMRALAQHYHSALSFAQTHLSK